MTSGSAGSTLTIVQGSDLHFGKPHDPRSADAFRRATEALDPDVLVLSGDFTQRAKVAEFDEARRYIDTLPAVPKVVVPGNHDVPLYRVFERLFHPLRNYKSYISQELDTVLHLGGATIVGLDTTSPHGAIVGGRLRRSQVEFARDAFREAPDSAVRIVVAHHHLAPAPDYERDRPLRRSREILDQFEAMNVEIVLGGHLHRAYIGNSLDVYGGSDPRHGIVIVQSGTTTSNRGRARERARKSFNVIRIESQVLDVTHYMYFGDEDVFRPFSAHRFPRRPRTTLTEDPFGRRLVQDSGTVRP